MTKTTKSTKRILPSAIAATLGIHSSTLELRKSRVGAALLVSGVTSIDELSCDRVCILSHSGRITVLGERLSLGTLENRTVSVIGRITGVNFTYAKL